MQPQAPERLETRRLLLRRPRPADAEPIFRRYAGDPRVTRYLAWTTHRSVEDTRAFLAFSDTEWERWPAGPYLALSLADGSLLGSTGLAFESPRQAATGYVFAHDAWGQGYATEALGSMVEAAALVGVERLSALCHPRHRASWRVLEKCGFERQGILPDHSELPNLRPGVAMDLLAYTCNPTRREE